MAPNHSARLEQSMICLGMWNGNASEKYVAVLNEETREYRCGVSSVPTHPLVSSSPSFSYWSSPRTSRISTSETIPHAAGWMWTAGMRWRCTSSVKVSAITCSFW